MNLGREAASLKSIYLSYLSGGGRGTLLCHKHALTMNCFLAGRLMQTARLLRRGASKKDVWN